MRSRALATIVLTLLAEPMFAATAYRIEQSHTGPLARSTKGKVVTNGRHARIDFEVGPDEVTTLTSIIVSESGEVIALNASNETWYRMLNRNALGIAGLLFGDLVKKGALAGPRLSLSASKPGSTEDFVLSFSYSLKSRADGQTVVVDVSGQTRAWKCPAGAPAALPWNPAEFGSAIAELNAAATDLLSRAHPSLCHTITTLTQQYKGGAKRNQVIERRAFDFTSAEANEASFAVPRGYTYQEPQFGLIGRQ